MDNIVLKDEYREFTILVDCFPHKSKFIAGLCKLFQFYNYDAQELIEHLESMKDKLDDNKKLKLLCENIARIEKYQGTATKNSKSQQYHSIPLW